MSDQRLAVNSEIRAYWKEYNKSLDYTRTKTRKIPQFTRHNGKKLKRLQTTWKYPKSSQGNLAIMKVPKIGYKGPERDRGKVRAYGMRPKVITNSNQLSLASNSGHLPVIGANVGARRRKVLLECAKKNNWCLYLT